jgi:hypothetical protein
MQVLELGGKIWEIYSECHKKYLNKSNVTNLVTKYICNAVSLKGQYLIIIEKKTYDT